MNVEITEKSTTYKLKGTHGDKVVEMTALVDNEGRITLVPYDGEYHRFEFKNSDPALIFAMSQMMKELVEMVENDRSDYNG